MHGTEFRLFGAKASPPTHTINVAHNIAAVGKTFNVFSYDAVSAEHRTHHLPSAGRMLYRLRHRREFSRATYRQSDFTTTAYMPFRNLDHMDCTFHKLKLY